jgi:hypothetical protein
VIIVVYSGVRSNYEKQANMLSQIRATTTMLEYWKDKTTPLRAKILSVAIELLGIIAADIYDNELVGVADLKD